MPNLASVLKAEVTRLARKEVRSEADGLKKTVAAQRAELVAIRRRLQDLEKVVKSLGRAAVGGAPKTQPVSDRPDESAEASEFRFRAGGMASNRKRLGLSAAEFGLLVGATGQSVYSWEAGKSKPRARNLAAIAALRGVGKREVAAKLAALKASE